MLWGPAEYSVWGALKEHFVDRGIHGMHHAQPWWYYAKVLPPQLLPWTFLVPGALVLAWRRRDRMDRFLLVTVVFVVLFFSISTEKRTLYVLPAFPAFALMTARFVGAFLGWDEGPAMSRRWITVGQSFLAGLLILLGVAAPFAAQRVDEFPTWIIYVLAGLFLATGLRTLWAVIKKKDFAAAVFPGVGFATAFLFVAILVYPMANTFKSSREFATVIAEETAVRGRPGTRSWPSISATCRSTTPSTPTASTRSRPKKSPIWRVTSIVTNRSLPSPTPNGSTSCRRRSANESKSSPQPTPAGGTSR